MNYEFEGTSPDVHPEASVCDEATLVGDVRIGANASVWPGAVLRGDFDPVTIGAGTHVEDNTVVHGATVESRVMIGHGAILDGEATVERGTLVGNNAVVNHGASVGERSIVASGAVVPDGMQIPPSSFVRGVPATATAVEETSVNADEILGFYSPDAYARQIESHEDLFGIGPDG